MGVRRDGGLLCRPDEGWLMLRQCDAIGMDARDNEGLAGAINGESANEARRDKKNARGSDLWLS
jgi:hypothetical protein